MKMAANALVDLYAEHRGPDDSATVYIVDADNTEIADYLESKVRAIFPDAPIKRVGLNPIIGAHTGPSLAAIIHLS